jgi:flagellar biosynthesis protein FliR
LTTLFGDLTFDRANDPLIHVCNLLSFVSVTAFFAHERIVGEIFVVQVNYGIRPRLSPTSQPVEHLSEIYTVELEMKFFAHDGHNYLARFAADAKSFLVEGRPAG